MKCPNIKSPEFKNLVDKYGINKAYALFNADLDSDPKLDKQNRINANMKIVSALNILSEPQPSKDSRKGYTTPQAKIKTIRLSKWESISKTMANMGVPSDQIVMMHEYMMANNIGDISTSELADQLASNLAYDITLNPAMKVFSPNKGGDVDGESFTTQDGKDYYLNYREDNLLQKLNPDLDLDTEIEAYYIENGVTVNITTEEYNAAYEKDITTKPYTSYPGVTLKKYKRDINRYEYQEFTMNTPFNTIAVGHFADPEKSGPTTIAHIRGYHDKETDTFIVIELQSDLFQKGRGNDRLTTNDYRHIVQYDNKISDINDVLTKTIKDRDKEQRAIDKLSGQVTPENKKIINSRLDSYKDTMDRLNTRITEYQNALNIAKESRSNFLKNRKPATSEDNFLNLLSKDGRWIKFTIETIIQNAAKKGFKSVRFPSGATAATVEGLNTVEETIIESKDRIERSKKSLPETIDRINKKRDLEIDNAKQNIGIERENIINTSPDTSLYDEFHYNGRRYQYNYISGKYSMAIGNNAFIDISKMMYNTAAKKSKKGNIKYDIDEINKKYDKFIDQANQDTKASIARDEATILQYKTEGIDKLAPIESFYEGRVKNILKKTYKSKEITDEYGHKFNEVAITKEVIEDVNDIDFMPAFTKEETENLGDEAGMIPGIHSNIQAMAVNNLTQRFITAALEHGKANSKVSISKYRASIEAKINEWEAEYQEAIEDSEEFEGEFQEEAKEDALEASLMIETLRILLQDVNSPLSKVVAQAYRKIETLNDFKVSKDKIRKKKTLEDKLENLEEHEAALDRTSSYGDEFSVLMDSRKTMSSNLRLFLASIRDAKKDENGDIVAKRDFLGNVVYINFNEAYQELHRVLNANSPNYDKLMDALMVYSGIETGATDKLWINNLIEELDNAPLETQAEFVSDMTKHYVDMRMLSFDKVWNGTSFDYNLTVKNNNQSALTNANIIEWSKQLKISDVLEYDHSKQDFKYTITEAMYTEVKNAYDALKGSNDPTTLINYLKLFSITLDSKAAKEITDKPFIYLENGGKVNYRNLKNGALKHLFLVYEEIYGKSQNNSVYLKDNSLLDQSTVRTLGRINAKYTPDMFTNSYRVGDKSIYSYQNNKYAMDRLRQLLDNENGVLDELGESLFSRNSLYGEELRKDISNLRGWMGISYASLKPIDQDKGSQKSLPDLTAADHEFRKIGDFYANKNYLNNSRFRQRKAAYSYPTSSDKSINLIMNAMAIELDYNKDGSISDSQIDLMIDYVVKSEWERIHLTKDIKHLQGKGHDMFYFFPEMNTRQITQPSSDKQTKETLTFRNLAIETLEMDSTTREAIAEIIRERINKEAEDKVAFWNANDIGTSKFNEAGKVIENYRFLPKAHLDHMSTHIQKDNGVKIKDTAEMNKYMATEMVFNYMINNANMFQLFIGDIALYNKNKEGKTLDENYVATIDNLGKRMASEIAPGYSLSNHVFKELFGSDLNPEGTKYIQIYMNDFKTGSNTAILDYYNKLLKNRSHKYDNIDSTDAQEYTTWKEHLSVMLSTGRIKQSEYKELVSILSSGGKLRGKQLRTILQPMKPVYTNSKFYKSGDIKLNKRTYIKSSSFPLLPQLTEGIEMDKLRIYMESLEKSVEEGGMGMPVRSTYGTAVKVGMPDIANNIFADDGTINEIIGHDLDANQDIDGGANVVYETLSREGLRIQQDIPYDADKSEINVGSQESKLFFNNLLGDNINKFKYDGDDKSGGELQQIYLDLVQKQFEYKYNNFVKRFTTNTGQIKTKKISEMLEDELYRTNPPTISEVKGLEVKNGEFVTPLWLSPHSKKYSALINALITNGTIKRKVRGKSYILGSEAGFKKLMDSKQGIVTTDAYNGQELLPMRLDEDKSSPTFGEVLPAQIMVPFPFKDHNGKKLKLSDFTVDGKVDMTKLPKDLLEGFGFRIPTQSHSSMTYFEIVGFLPDNQGDLIIAPKEFVEQMGSDFDVDKLYSYLYNTYYNEETGVLTKIVHDENTLEKDNKDYDANLQNKILDVHLSVMKNNDPIVQASIINPLGFGTLPKYKKIMEGKIEDSTLPTYLSDGYNREKYMAGVSGQLGTAVFAQASVFNATTQTAKEDDALFMYHIEKINKKNVSVRESLRFGNKYKKWDGNLSSSQSLKINNFLDKSEILAAFLSASVDNEKERLLDILNINKHTFPVISFLIQAGYEEDIIIPFINQDIVREYVNELNKSGSIVSIATILDHEDIATKIRPSIEYNEELADFNGRDAESVMLDMIKNPTYTKYSQYQAAILDKFLEIEKLAIPYNAALPLANVDSKGLGKNLVQSQLKINRLSNALQNKGEIKINNIDHIVANSPSGMAFDNYIRSLQIFKDQFINLQEGDAFDRLVGLYETATNKSSEEISDKELDGLNDAIKFYALSLNSDRRLFLLKGEDSILKRLQQIQNTSFFKNNQFLKRLDLTGEEKIKGYDAVTFSMNTADEFTDDIIYQGLVAAITSNREVNGVDMKRLMDDLMEYGILDGARFGPQSFAKYIPTIYFEKFGLNKFAKDFNLPMHSPYIVEQYIQHNPELATFMAGKGTNKGFTFKPIDPILRPKYIKNGFGDKLRLYKYNSETNIYNRISILGDGKILNEYSIVGLSTAESIIPTHHGPRSYGEEVAPGVYGDISQVTQGRREILNDQLWNKESASVTSDTMPEITEEPMSLYDAVKVMDNPLMNEFMRVFEDRLRSSTIQIDPKLKSLGNTAGNKIRLSKNFYENSPTGQVLTTIIHETVHILTSEILNNRHLLTNDQRIIVDKIMSKRVSIVENLNDAEIDDMTNVIKYLFNFWSVSNSKGSNGVTKEGMSAAKLKLSQTFETLAGTNDKLDSLFRELEESSEPISTADYDVSQLSQDDLRKYYALINDKEFLAVTMSEESFRNFIDEKLGDAEGMNQIREWIKQLLELLGISNEQSSQIVDLMFKTGELQRENQYKFNVKNRNKLAKEKTSLGFVSNQYDRFEFPGGVQYKNASGEVLSEAQINTLSKLNVSEEGSHFPYERVFNGKDFMIHEDGTFSDDRGITYSASANLSEVSPELSEAIQDKDVTKPGNQTMSKMKAIAYFHSEQDAGRFASDTNGTLYAIYDVYDLVDNYGNLIPGIENQDMYNKVQGIMSGDESFDGAELHKYERIDLLQIHGFWDYERNRPIRVSDTISVKRRVFKANQGLPPGFKFTIQTESGVLGVKKAKKRISLNKVYNPDYDYSDDLVGFEDTQEPNGRTYLNQLSEEDLKYIMTLAQDELIEIKC